MLHTLCGQLHSDAVPLVTTLATCAAQALLAHAHSTMDVSASPSTPPRPAPASTLQERALRLMHALYDTGELLGAQGCLIVNGRVLVDAAAGQMSTIDPRPVRPDDLFQLFGAGSPLLATLVLQETHRGALRLEEPVTSAPRPTPYALRPTPYALRPTPHWGVRPLPRSPLPPTRTRSEPFIAPRPWPMLDSAWLELCAGWRRLVAIQPGGQE